MIDIMYTKLPNKRNFFLMYKTTFEWEQFSQSFVGLFTQQKVEFLSSTYNGNTSGGLMWEVFCSTLHFT